MGRDHTVMSSGGGGGGEAKMKNVLNKNKTRMVLLDVNMLFAKFIYLLYLTTQAYARLLRNPRLLRNKIALTILVHNCSIHLHLPNIYSIQVVVEVGVANSGLTEPC